MIDKILQRRMRHIWKLKEPCWIWFGASNNAGYGIISNGKPSGAHRYFYEKLVGPIPNDMTLDHLCRNRRCVNPKHLELVTVGENAKRAAWPPDVREDIFEISPESVLKVNHLHAVRIRKNTYPISGLRVNGKPVHAEAGVREVCRALQYVATTGSGAHVEPAPRQLLEAIGAGQTAVFDIHTEAELELAPRLRTMAEQANNEDDFDLASVLASVATALEMARKLAEADSGKAAPAKARRKRAKT